MRRRAFRPMRRALRRALTPNIPPALQRANQLMAAGDYAAAAAAFADLAQRAEGNFPQHAPSLYMQAGRAAILSGQTKIGVAHLRRGLTLFASQGRFERMQAFGQRAVDELSTRGLTAEAAEINDVLRANLPQRGIAAGGPAKKPVLPTHCPGCGAPVRPDEVEWLDEATAECAFCGSPVRAES
ncbi:MAG: hypothetical protein ACOYZ8_01300 [Chloroflexota bacterium]